ncbi:MAG: hypothetical protein FWH54_01490 [Methanobrevibacter sp.]|nr:hypothetical protein [Methanobrevibacter sp.]
MFEKIRTQNLIMIILLVVYSLIALTLFPIKNLVFWTGYIFTVLAFILLIVLNNKLFNDKVKSSFNSFPLVIISYIYLAIQIAFSFVLMSLNIFTIFSIYAFEVSLAIEVIILAIFFIVAILLLKSVDYIGNIEKTTKEQISFTKNLQKEVEILYNKYMDGIYKNQLFELYEIVRYSNPMSTTEIKSLEEEITKNLDNLKKELKNNNENHILNLINELKDILNEREIRLK